MGLLKEEALWHYPASLQLGPLEFETEYELILRLVVPVPSQLTSHVEGLTVEPIALRPGKNEVILRVEPLGCDTLLRGKLWLCSTGQELGIAVEGHAILAPDGKPQAPKRRLAWEPVDWEILDSSPIGGLLPPPPLSPMTPDGGEFCRPVTAPVVGTSLPPGPTTATPSPVAAPIRVGFPQKLAPESVDERWKSGGGFVLVRSNRFTGEDCVFALRSKCTHMGCDPAWLSQLQRFKCPCHGSGFNITGINFEGPASRPLERLRVFLDPDGQLVVDPSQTYRQESGQWSNPESYVLIAQLKRRRKRSLVKGFAGFSVLAILVAAAAFFLRPPPPPAPEHLAAESFSQDLQANTSETIRLRGRSAKTDSALEFTYVITAPPLNGRVSQFDVRKGAFVYTPWPHFSGTDRLSYKVTAGGDASLASDSETATVTLIVSSPAPLQPSPSEGLTKPEETPPPVPPSIPLASSFLQDVKSRTTPEVRLRGTRASGSVDGSLTYTIVEKPSHGTVSQFDEQSGTFVYTPAPGFGGTDRLIYTVTVLGNSSLARTSKPATVTFNVEGPPPALIETTIGMQLLLIPEGRFTMGVEDPDSQHDGPPHLVALTRPFYLGKTEVTQADWRTIMTDKPHPSSFSPFAKEGRGKERVAGQDTSQHPVEAVSWFDAIEFCNRLSVKEGLRPYYERKGDGVAVLDPRGTGFRLPTEAESRRTCRANTDTTWSFGNDEAQLDRHAWFEGNSFEGKVDGMTHPASKKSTNPFGLHDMNGNVWEWCWDWDAPHAPAARNAVIDPKGPAEGEFRVIRGGAWTSEAKDTRSAHRSSYDPHAKASDIGFRVARSLAATN